jgi:hypothetical protein
MKSIAGSLGMYPCPAVRMPGGQPAGYIQRDYRCNPVDQLKKTWVRSCEYRRWRPAQTGCLVPGLMANPAPSHCGLSSLIVWNLNYNLTLF